MGSELNYEKYSKYITVENKVNYILSKVSDKISIFANRYDIDEETINKILKGKIIVNIKCVNNQKSLQRYVQDSLEFCEYELQKVKQENYNNHGNINKEDKRIDNERFIINLEDKYINSIKDKIEFSKYIQDLDSNEVFIGEKLYGNNNKKVNLTEILDKLNISLKEYECIKARLNHKLLMAINPKMFLKLVNKKNKVTSFECMGYYRRKRCFHNGDTCICLKAKECKELTNNKNGKCVCEFKSKCPQIRQSIFMKYKPDEEEKYICEFYKQFNSEIYKPV